MPILQYLEVLIKMAKFPRQSKITKDEQDKLLIWLCEAISKLRDSKEAAEFLKDLLSRQEAEMLARRLKTAELLMDGLTYSEIADNLKISSGTIAKIHEWLRLSGSGYRLVLQRIPKNQTIEQENLYKDFSWSNVKRRYPVYFWPQLVLESVISSAKEKDRQKIKIALNKMDKKSKLFKRLNKLFYYQNRKKFEK